MAERLIIYGTHLLDLAFIMLRLIFYGSMTIRTTSATNLNDLILLISIIHSFYFFKTEIASGLGNLS
jgi:hypothetical protein